MHLMWHADDNWANPLWWLRAFRSVSISAMLHTKGSKTSRYLVSKPGGLWWALSATSFLVFLAVPLSGLTMELTTVSAPTSNKAAILGPNPATFNLKGIINIPQIARGNWRAGRRTTPADSSFFYAPKGTTNVSTEYYHDQIQDTTTRWLQTFLPPSVDGLVTGSVWGMLTNISCEAVLPEKLKLMKVANNGSISVYDQHRDGQPVYFPYDRPAESAPLFVNETATWMNTVQYSMLAKADGTWYGSTMYDSNVNTNHDYQTFDGASGRTPASDATTGLLEIYLKQAFAPGQKDSTMTYLLNSHLPSIQVFQQELVTSVNDGLRSFDFAAFGVQCKVQSEMGRASIDPATRTYSSFTGNQSAINDGGDDDVYPPQVQAVEALGNYDPTGYEFKPSEGTRSFSTWLSLHLATRISAYRNITCETATCNFLGSGGIYAYPALTPENVTLAAYKLLGETVIAIMGPGNQQPWFEDLYTFETITWLKPGIVPWQLVIALLGIWTLLVMSASLVALFSKRWTPALSGFNFFCSGAQYADNINTFTSRRFEGNEALRSIPGLVGSMEGTEKGSDMAFIGLSDYMAKQDGEFVFDRPKAGYTLNRSI